MIHDQHSSASPLAHRRMSDRAITASEHVDLRLADLSARVDELRSQVQRILTDVE